MKNVFCALVVLTLFGCTMRNSGMTLEPQLYTDGQIVYVYSDLANFAQPDQDAAAEKNRLQDLHDWVVDAAICPNGYEIIKRQPVATRVWAQAKKVYYFIKCK